MFLTATPMCSSFSIIVTFVVSKKKLFATIGSLAFETLRE
jgi:hypothetical protein